MIFFVLISSLWVGHDNHQLHSVILILFWPTNVGLLDESAVYLHYLPVIWICGFVFSMPLYFHCTSCLVNCSLLTAISRSTRIWKQNAMGAVPELLFKIVPRILISSLSWILVFQGVSDISKILLSGKKKMDLNLVIS